MLDDRHARYSKPARQLIVSHFEWCRAKALPGCWLRIRGGACRMEGDVAFDLLHDLMDMTFQHGEGAKTAQLAHELFRVSRTPTPGLIDRPQRHVGKDHDGRAR